MGLLVRLVEQTLVARELLAQCSAAGGQQAWAQAHGLSLAYVNDVLHGRRQPGKRICAALGFRRVVLYEPVRQENEP
jgi:DNA-binding transcriptional regulator YdaS (Cro superfamily)